MQAVAQRRQAIGTPSGRHALFTPTECEALGADFWRACTTVIVPAGTKRYAADLPQARILLVQRGVVLLRTAGGSGLRSMVVCRCSAGAVLPPPAGGEALQSLTDAWVTAVPPSAWSRLLSVPDAAARLVAGLEETLLAQRESASALAGIRHVDRVRRQLIELARDHGRVCRDGIRIDLPLTHDLLADMVGCARETATRAFDELQRAGFVARSGRFYRLLVPPESLGA
jgi:Crp-like helix-turn-helix protein